MSVRAIDQTTRQEKILGAPDVAAEAEGLWIPIFSPGGSYMLGGAAVGTYVPVPSASAVGYGVNFSSLGKFGFDPANFAVAGKRTMMKAELSILTSATAPGASVTAKARLNAVSANNSGNAAIDQGTQVGADSPALGPLAARTPYTLKIAAFDASALAAGDFAPGLILAGATTAAGALITIQTRILVQRIV